MRPALLTAALLSLGPAQAGGMGGSGMPGMTHMTLPMTPSASVPGLSQMGLQMQLDMRAMMMPMMNDLARLSGRSFERAFMSINGADSFDGQKGWVSDKLRLSTTTTRRPNEYFTCPAEPCCWVVSG